MKPRRAALSSPPLAERPRWGGFQEQSHCAVPVSLKNEIETNTFFPQLLKKQL